MSTAHIVAHVAPAWGMLICSIDRRHVANRGSGHMKPLLVFFVRLAELRPVSSIVLTLLTGEPILQKVLSEIKRMPTSIAERIK
jgi:hypothetical protein